VQGNGASSLIFLVILIGLFYFMLIRPQKKRVQQHAQLVSSVDVGDEVITIGGLYGTVRSLDEDEIQLEVAPGTTIRFVKSAISRKVTLDDDDSLESTDSASEDGE
jgi:preprotein translocase subunit YajC